MKKPTEAIERVRELYRDGCLWDDSIGDALDYIDSIPEWPADLTRGRLEEMADACGRARMYETEETLRRLAAIAPKREKRKVEIWESPENQLRCFNMAPPRNFQIAPGWRKVGEVEIDA